MGELIAWRYRTTMFLKLADHTYVTCGNRGKAWGCWGGETGGTILRRGTGSTRRADAIAEPDERAGITCYLINGVCHQAANRILLPAGITVRGARGYGLSEALFGVYGRPRGLLGFCRAPFNRHAGVSGDLPECTDPGIGTTPHERLLISAAPDDENERYRGYLAAVQEVYDQIETPARGIAPEETADIQLTMFGMMVDYNLGEIKARDNLMEIRSTVERRRTENETLFEQGEIGTGQFLDHSNGIEIAFQDEIANALDAETYRALLDLDVDDRVILGDPMIAYRDYEGTQPFDRR